MKRLIISLIVIVSLSSCSYRVMDFSIVSTKNVEFSKFSDLERGSQRIEGEDSKPIIIIIPTGMPNGEEAIDRAIESVPGAVALVDGVLTYKWFYIPYIYGKYTYIVEGTPLIDPALANLSTIDDYSVCILNENGDIESVHKLTPEKYMDFRNEAFNSPNRAYRKMKN